MASVSSELINVILTRKNPVVFDRQDKFVFFPNNKVCQRAIIRNLLKDRAIVRKDNVEEWETKAYEVCNSNLHSVFKFTLVRNPFDRAVSAYSYLQGQGIIAKHLTFSQFCSEILSEQGVSFDPHFDEQSNGLIFHGQYTVDFVARYEKLSIDWPKIAQRVGACQELIRVGSSRRMSDFTKYYDPGSRQIIERIYREDLELFDYGFDRPPRRGWLSSLLEWLRFSVQN